MLNMIRMEVFRMFKTKSLYVIWILLSLGILFTTSMSAVEWNEYTEAEKQENYAYASGELSDEVPNLGMTVTLPTKPDEEVSVFDLFYANIKGKFLALFLVIFAVLYSTADLTCGYVKNIAGQVRNRGGFVFAKACALFLFTVLSFLVFLAVQTIGNGIFFGKIVWGDWNSFLPYIGIQALLHFALLMIVMCIAIVLKNNVISMMLAVCLCMNVLMILYRYLDKLIADAGVKNFYLENYTATGRIAILPMSITADTAEISAAVSLGFVLVSLVLAGVVFQKRDI